MQLAEWLRQSSEPQAPLQQTLDQILQRLSKIENKQNPPSPANRTWAAVAALPQHREPTPLKTTTGYTITIRPNTEKAEGLRGQSETEVLTEIRKEIYDAVAVRHLRSGDIRVTLKDQQAKERAVRAGDRLGERIGIKVLREDYPVEILAVPISLRVEKGRQADNTATIQEIVKQTERLIPGLEITRIQWLRQENANQANNENNERTRGSPETRQGDAGRTHGSLIVSTHTPGMQKLLIQKGIIINGLIYNARLYNHKLRLERCYRCAQWGHTQSTCAAQVCCGHCAGPHDTRHCSNQDQTKCANCHRSTHKAWEREDCIEYRRRKARAQQLREQLHARSYEWKQQAISQGDAGAFPAFPTFNIGGLGQPSQASTGQKRRRATSPDRTGTQGSQGTQGRGRPVGRPPWTATASSRPGQSRIRFNAANITFAADPQRAHSRPAGEEPETITDSDIEALVGTQDTGMESSTQNE